MKKLIAVLTLVLAFFFTISVKAKVIDVGQGLSIEILSSTEYLQIPLKKIYSEFPEISIYSDDFENMGFKENAQLTIMSDNNKSLKLYKSLTNKNGFKKLKKKYWDPFMKIMESKEFEILVVNSLKKRGKDPYKMSAKQVESEMARLFQNEDFKKKFNNLISPVFNKFDKEFNTYTGTTTIILTADKEIQIKDLIGNKTPAMIKKDIKDFIKMAAKEDFNVKPYTKWKFDVKKNHNGVLYLYSDHYLPDFDWMSGKIPENEIFITTNNNKLFAAFSTCYNNCRKENIFKMISTTNLLEEKVEETVNKGNSAEDLVDRLNKLNQLYEKGSITKEEFERAKELVLN